MPKPGVESVHEHLSEPVMEAAKNGSSRSTSLGRLEPRSVNLAPPTSAACPREAGDVTDEVEASPHQGPVRTMLSPLTCYTPDQLAAVRVVVEATRREAWAQHEVSSTVGVPGAPATEPKVGAASTAAESPDVRSPRRKHPRAPRSSVDVREDVRAVRGPSSANLTPLP
jgi:hypothetical protein